MTWQVVRSDDVAPMPWRNGGGLTRELMAWPSAGDWTWRVSLAVVERDGPFSAFEGVDRWFAVLDGAGVELSLGAETHRLTPDDPPLCFDGGRSVHCKLLSGTTEDLNLMVRRHATHGRSPRASRMSRVVAGSGVAVGPRSAVAVFALVDGCAGRLQEVPAAWPARSLAWTHVEEHAELRIDSGRAWVMAVVD